MSIEKASTDHFVSRLKSDQHIRKFRFIKSITLEQVFIQNKLTKIDFLKLDCEGAEGLIFKSTPKSYLKKIRKIAIEYHDHLSPMKHQEIVSTLRGLDFKVIIVSGERPTFGYIYAKNMN